MTFRKTVFWLHLSLGLALSAVVLLLAVTGSILVFEHPVEAWADRPWSHLKDAPSGPRLSLEALAQAARRVQAGPTLSGMTLRRDPQAAVLVQFGREKSFYVDPYSGAVIGEGRLGTRDFFKGVEGLHRWFGIQGKPRQLARQLKYACNAAFLFLIVAGFYLWWPRKLVLPKRGLKGKLRDFNWHNTLGFLAWPFIFSVSFTGLFMSYDWASSRLYKLDGGAMTRSPLPAVAPKLRHPGPASLEDYFNAAQAQRPDWKVLSLRLPKEAGASVNITLQSADDVLPSSRASLTLNAATAAVENWEPYQDQSLGRRLNAWARWVHTGEAASWPGQVLAFLTCLALITMVYTGVALSWRRFFSRT